MKDEKKLLKIAQICLLVAFISDMIFYKKAYDKLQKKKYEMLNAASKAPYKIG